MTRRSNVRAREPRSTDAAVTFSRSRFDALFRWRTIEAEVPSRELSNGWSKLAPDPMRLLEGYPHLKIRSGFVLRAYQYYAEGNGNAVVWAMPEDAPFPEPEACERLEGWIANAPRPPAALADIMEAIEGDGTPESYLSAAMFERDCGALGAYWHGVSRSAHDILFEDPLASPDSPCLGGEGRDEWRWKEEPPLIWAPCVERTRSGSRVTFHTFSDLVREAVYRHVDRFRRGTLCFKSSTVVLAEGSSGIIC